MCVYNIQQLPVRGMSIVTDPPMQVMRCSKRCVTFADPGRKVSLQLEMGWAASPVAHSIHVACYRLPGRQRGP